jgi:NADPH:quinone reductase-like Zn-dependent oxidoreductase
MNLGAGLDGLTIKEHDVPVPGPREVLIRIRACSLSYRDLMILFKGKYPLPIRADVIPVSDGVGEIVGVGADVTRVKLGDRVAGSMFPNWIDGPFSWEYAAQLGGSLHGMLTEYAVLSEEAIVQIPEYLSFEEAATLPCAAVTAWNALTGGQPLEAGNTVLVLGSGGVSLFALQLAKLFGARVIATTSSDKKADLLKALGANEVINYKETPDWHTAVRMLTGGRGVDHVVEVGGAGTIENSIKSTAFEGQISLIGGLTNGESMIDYKVIASNVLTIRSIAVGRRAHFIAMNRAISINQLKPVINQVFEFEEARSAFSYLKKGQHFGKVVIRIN